MYKTVVIEYSPKADDMHKELKKKLILGYELITMAIY